MTEKTEFLLPDEIVKSKDCAPVDLVIISQPKMGKSSIFGDFTLHNNAVVLSLECGGYQYIDARKIEIYDSNETTYFEAFKNYMGMRDALLKNKGKYEFLLVDGLSDLDALSVLGGTYDYMQTAIGKAFNKDAKTGEIYKFGDERFKLVTVLPDGNGYQHTRNWFMKQIDIFRQIAPKRIFAAHIQDKLLRDGGKEEVSGSELALTGKLKTIFAAKVTALGKLVADENKRYLNFQVQNDGIIAGSRSPHLKDKILISEMGKDNKLVTHWDSIYKC